MIDVKKQIQYWVDGAKNDFESAIVLIESKRYLHGLFFCHLVIEKMIKAHVVKNTNEIAPKSHNLLYLVEKANLKLAEEDEIFLGILMKYQIQGRYPDYNPKIPNQSDVKKYVQHTKRMMQWLEMKL